MAREGDLPEVVRRQLALYRIYMFLTDPRVPGAIERLADVAGQQVAAEKARAEWLAELGQDNPFAVLEGISFT